MTVLRKIIQVVAQASGWLTRPAKVYRPAVEISVIAIVLCSARGSNTGNRAVGCSTPPVRGARLLIINPVFLGVGHSTAARNRTCWSGLVKGVRKRTVAEGLGSIAAPTRVPLINDDLDRHPAAPDALPALLLESSYGEPPMTALAVDRSGGGTPRHGGGNASSSPPAARLSTC